MTARYVTAAVLAALVVTSRAQSTNHNAAGLSQPATGVVDGQTLFLRNCAHCHGANAHGDDGPDLHGLDLTDDWIANRICKGKAGEMTAFAGKLQPAEIAALVTYVQTLK